MVAIVVFVVSDLVPWIGHVGQITNEVVRKSSGQVQVPEASAVEVLRQFGRKGRGEDPCPAGARVTERWCEIG